MGSLYLDRVEGYGRHWQRPWIGLLLIAAVPGGLYWLTQALTKPIEGVTCTQQQGRRYRAAVDVDGLMWTADLEAALDCAHQHNRQVFVAIEAIYDCNCVINKRTVFRDREVRQALRRYVLVTLDTFVVPPEYYVKPVMEKQCKDDGVANLEFEREALGTLQEPLYAVLQPTGNGTFRIVGVYDEALINFRGDFVDFLANPQAAGTRDERRRPPS